MYTNDAHNVHRYKPTETNVERNRAEQFDSKQEQCGALRNAEANFILLDFNTVCGSVHWKTIVG